MEFEDPIPGKHTRPAGKRITAGVGKSGIPLGESRDISKDPCAFEGTVGHPMHALCIPGGDKGSISYKSRFTNTTGRPDWLDWLNY